MNPEDFCMADAIAACYKECAQGQELSTDEVANAATEASTSATGGDVDQAQVVRLHTAFVQAAVRGALPRRLVELSLSVLPTDDDGSFIDRNGADLVQFYRESVQKL